MIKFVKITKTFPSGVTALRDIDFTVDTGEMMLITGPSGSGKTTLLKLLLKEYTPSSGELFFQDELVNQIKQSQLPQHRRKIGVVFQDYKLLNELNVWENIALPLYILKKNEQEIESRVTDLLKLVSLTDKALMFPSQLSGGEAQRIGIARALATGPKVVFADEPTGNLDPETSLGIIKLLKKINDLGTTILLATHDMVVLDQLSKIRKISLKGGQMVSDSGQKTVKKAKDSHKIEIKFETLDSDEKEEEKAEKEVKNKKKQEKQSREDNDIQSKDKKNEQDKQNDHKTDPDEEKDQPKNKKTGPRIKLPKIKLSFGIKKKDKSTDQKEK